MSSLRPIRGNRAVSTAAVLLGKPYAGTVVAAAVGLFVLVLAVAGFGFGFGWVGSWRVIGFPGALPPFSDLHVVTDNASRCADAAISEYPYIHARCDPWHQGYNYPPVWLLLGRLGINGGHTALLAFIIELPALVLFALLIRGRSVACGLVALALMLSPSVVLGFERGNIDIVEWILVCSAALLYSEQRALRAVAALVILCFAVVIKFLAIFCCTLAIRLRPMSLIVSALLVIFSLAYLYSLSDLLQLIRNNTGGGFSPYVSYGYMILFDRLEVLYGPRLGLDLTGLTASWFPIMAVAGVLLAALIVALAAWRCGHLQYRLCEGSDGIAFLFGSGIFCGSFALLGTNYTYRLMFLLLCLPQLFDWMERARIDDVGSRRMAYLLIGSCIISMWLKFHPEVTLHINQITDWILFGTLTMIVAANGLYACASLWTRRALQLTAKTPSE